MKLEPGKCSYALPPIGQIINVGVTESGRPGYLLLLARRSIDELIDMRLGNHALGGPEKRDIPEYYALSHHGDTLELCPAPDRAYDCNVKFFPPVQEI